MNVVSLHAHFREHAADLLAFYHDIVGPFDFHIGDVLCYESPHSQCKTLIENKLIESTIKLFIEKELITESRFFEVVLWGGIIRQEKEKIV